jgi:hypothetical protein
MRTADHRELLTRWAQILDRQEWDKLGEVVHDDTVLEFPQSGERFRGLQNVRAQFENYPGMEPGSAALAEVVGGTDYALAPNYTIVAVSGSGDRGTAILRVQYPDGSWWWAINFYELVDGRIGRTRFFFAADFDPPDWRAPYRET